jgi:thiamine-monophosphate kinase
VAGERRLTAELARFFPSARHVEVGIGDDAAVLTPRGGRQVVCCDPVVEGVHFTADAPLTLVGRKAVNRNLADLAAMGATPDWLLVSLLLPHSLPRPALRALLRGIRSAARAADAPVVGGDIANTPGPLVVTVTAGGHLATRPLLRSGARAGDSIHVSGPLGGASRGHHLRFRPPLAEGAWLARQRNVHAAMDVSDGLLLDLATLLEASGGLGAELDAAAIPIRRAAFDLAGGDRERALRRALGDGEDHVLLWTQAPDRGLPRGGPLGGRARRAIGGVTRYPGLWLRRGAEREPLAVRGFQHDVAGA